VQQKLLILLHVPWPLPSNSRAALQWLRLRQRGKWLIREVKEEQPSAVEMIERVLARVAADTPIID